METSETVSDISQSWNGTGPVFTGLKFFLFNKFPLGPPQALVRNELHKFLDMEFFLSNVCRVQVEARLMLLQ
jgi:hypothetical protein